MRIGILGSGEIGGTLARLLTAAGHEIAVANRRGPGSLAGLVAELGGRARAVAVEEAIAFGDPLVVVAIPFGAYESLPADALAGKVVVDTTNYTPGRDGTFPDLESDRTTSSELIAAHLPGARLVKAVNTLNYKYLLDLARPGAAREERTALFVAGDDPEANRLVTELLDELGFAPVPTGSLAGGGRRQQPGTPVFNRPLDARLAQERWST
ncbi:NADPH-dependent F420 reductase [Streptomyces sp. NPDC001351]|uniref:NADPH-dependent F420 reductase n=1 Tax=Streptomyces sp. NPDC001351 TaxID=3364564 RepID=UPI0036BB3CA5